MGLAEAVDSTPYRRAMHTLVASLRPRSARSLLVATGVLGLAIQPAWSGAAREEYRLAFAPAGGTTVERSLSCATTVSGGELEVWMDGEPVPAVYLPQIELDSTDRIEVATVDRYLAAEDGIATSLLRHLRGARHTGSGSMDGSEGIEGQAWEYGGDSALLDQYLHFTRDGDSEEVTVAVVDGDSLEATDQDVPEGLIEDLDLRGLLPEEAIAVGSRWSAPAAALAGLLSPCGELDFDLGDEAARYMPEVQERDLEGRLKLELISVEDGLARIEVGGEIVQTVVTEGDLSQVPIASGEATDTEVSTIAVEAELVWSLAEGLARSFTLSGAIDREHWTRKDEGQEGPPYESRMTFAGELSVELAIATR